MNEILFNLVSTQKGWLIRQALKYTAVAGASLTTWLTSTGVEISDPAAITAALATLATGVVELLLSRVASKIAAK